MRVYKEAYRDKSGKKCKSRKWYVDFADHLRIRHRIPGFENKRQTEAFGRQIEKLANSLISGEGLDRELENWLNCLPNSLLDKLVQWGLVSGQRAETMKPIFEHLDDYIKVLKARNHSADYRQRMKSRVAKLTKHCKFFYFRDVTQSAVELYIGKLKKEGLGATTRGHYLDFFKTFLNWAKEDNRIVSNPLDNLRKESQDRERKGILTPEQFISLIQTTAQKNVLIRSISGVDRSILYFIAGTTGLRKKELLLHYCPVIDF